LTKGKNALKKQENLRQNKKKILKASNSLEKQKNKTKL
jgi:hypothetical protein